MTLNLQAKMPIQITLKAHPAQKKQTMQTPTPTQNADKYTKDILQSSFEVFTNYYNGRKALKDKGLKIRLPGFPEDISENMIKFILQRTGDETVHWNTKSGDLYSAKEGRIECKAFTSNGPLSFSPQTDWDVLYVMDAIEWVNDKYILYRVNIKKSSNAWSGILVKSNQTFGEQTKEGRRPRGVWNTVLKPQLGEHCEEVFNGTFNDMFISSVTAPTD